MKLNVCATLLLSGLAASLSVNSAQGLEPFKFDSFPPGSIRASGWLGDQLALEADGLAGHLFDFYRYVKESIWLGGTYTYSELHEDAPYWFNYIVPLAWSLDDARLKKDAKTFLDYTLDHQAEDGWLGPEKTRQTRGLWARSLLCFGLVQYAEADPTETERIVDSMHKFVTLAHTMLQANFTGLIEDKAEGDDFDPYGFGLMRTHELPISFMWLLDNHPRDNSKVIREAIELMFAGGRQGNGDWTTFFVEGVFPTQGTPYIETPGFAHGVNLAEGLRYPTVLYRISKNESLVPQTYMAVNLTTTYQTALSGTIIADEFLGSLNPQRGSETCTTVESMFSYAYLYRFYGYNDFADRAELAAFNALPAALTADCYPKFVVSAYVKQKDTVVHMLLSPTSVSGKLQGSSFSVDCETNYPFSGELNYKIEAERDFQFAIRVPGWVTDLKKTSISINGVKPTQLNPDASGLQYVPIRRGKTMITVDLPLEIRTVERNGSVGIYRGPLLYAADITINETSHQPLNWTDRLPLPASQVDPRSRDYVMNPSSPWQFAIDPSTLAVQQEHRVDSRLPNPVWTSGGPPTALSVDAYPIDWPLDLGTAAPPPINPVVDARTKTSLRLVPFGAAKLHIAQFPVANITS
ncbi:uncharacterized protein PFLUO_LOCUS9030 [Penicillium psychrofluorescens]|uniref:uncharacterized protein n=1 Tax=Penicillium psychrofluorescens TaxID=3158075 RepID=UPI003CCD82EF